MRGLRRVNDAWAGRRSGRRGYGPPVVVRERSVRRCGFRRTTTRTLVLRLWPPNLSRSTFLSSSSDFPHKDPPNNRSNKHVENILGQITSPRVPYPTCNCHTEKGIVGYAIQDHKRETKSKQRL